MNYLYEREVGKSIFFFLSWYESYNSSRKMGGKWISTILFDCVSTNYFTSDGGVKNQRDERGTSTWPILKNSTCPEATMATARNESCFPNSISFIEMRWFSERAQRSPQMAGPRWKVKIYAISHPQNGPGDRHLSLDPPSITEEKYDSSFASSRVAHYRCLHFFVRQEKTFRMALGSWQLIKWSPLWRTISNIYEFCGWSVLIHQQMSPD